jgi:hypothetical protein
LYGQRLTVNQLISPIRNKYQDGIVSFAPLADELARKLLLITINKDLPLKLEFPTEELRKNLTNLFYVYNPDNPVDLHRIRLRVSAIQHILSVCDNRSAWESRPKKDRPFLKELLKGGWRYGDCDS